MQQGYFLLEIAETRDTEYRSENINNLKNEWLIRVFRL
jgi:hypothetical protein